MYVIHTIVKDKNINFHQKPQNSQLRLLVWQLNMVPMTHWLKDNKNLANNPNMDCIAVMWKYFNIYEILYNNQLAKPKEFKL